jgi:hypothetical protein
VKKSRKIVAIILAAFLIGCAGLGLWYLRSDRFQEFARATLTSRLEKATGLDCRIHRLQFDAFHGRFIITGLALVPKLPEAGLGSLKVSEIRASISISSFWHFRIRLADLRILRPQVELLSGKGKSEWKPEEFLRALKMSLRLEAARAVVENGRFTVNDHTAPFYVALEDLDCEIRYAKEIPSYKIRIEYKKSRLIWEQRDFLHDLELRSDLSMRGVGIEHFRFRHGATIFTGSGLLKDWSSPVLSLHMAGTLDAQDLKLAAASLYEGKGKINVKAELRYDRNGIYSKGEFTSRAGMYRSMAYSSLAGKYEIKNDVLFLRDNSCRIANGSLLANGEIQLRTSNRAPNHVRIDTKNVPVIESARFLNLPHLNFVNTADTTAVLTWPTDGDLRAECDTRLHGQAPSAKTTGKSTYLDGSIRYTYSETGSVLNISSALLVSPNTTVEASGGRDDLFHIQLSTDRISEPFSLIAGISAPVADLLARQPDLHRMQGSFYFNGDVQIKSSSNVEYRGSVSVKNGSWRSFKVDSLSTRAYFNPPLLKLQSLVIQHGPQKVDGEFDMELADQDDIAGLRFHGNISQLSLATLKDFGVDPRLEGILSGSGSIQYARSMWEGDGRISIEKGKLGDEAFDSLQAQMKLADRKFHLMRAEARLGNARLDAEGQFDLGTQQFDIKTRLQGFDLATIPAIRAKQLPLHGLLGASGNLLGTPQKPIFSGSFNLDSLQYERWNFGHGKGTIDFADGIAKGSLGIQSEFGRFAIQADISTNTGYPGKASVEFADLDIQKILPSKAPPYLQEISTALNGKFDIEGKFGDTASLKMRGEVDGAHFKIQDYELHNAGRIQFSILNRMLRMESFRFIGDGTSLILSGSVPLEDGAPLDLALSGNLNLRILEGIEKKVHVAGAAALNIRASGSKVNPQIVGRASFQDAKLEYTDFPFRLSGMQGDMVFSRNLVRLENVRGLAASGTLQLSGVIEHQNAVFRSVNLGISIRNAHLPFPKDFRSVFNAELVLSGNRDVQILGGEVDVPRIEYVRGFNLMEQLANHAPIQTGPLTTEPFLMGLRLNIEIHSDHGLYIDNELTRLRGGLRLALRGTPAFPSLTGRVEADEGTIFFRGSRFEISHAAANFVDRNRINPVLEIRAEADVKTYRLILDAIGDLEHLNLNVTSDPPMSTVDILSLLTTGKADTRTATSQRESEMASISAASVLSENLTGVIGKRVQRIFGLESFRVDPFLAGAENDPTARITISERLSKDLVITFSRNLTTSREQIAVIEYDVGKGISMVATRDEYGKFGLDFRFRKRIR